MNSTFLDYYRCPEGLAHFTASEPPFKERGYFRFGPDIICYGRCGGGGPAKHSTDELYEALDAVVPGENGLELPFDPSEVVTNLRHERYVSLGNGAGLTGALIQNTYYLVRPLLPVPVRKHLQRIRLRDAQKIGFPHWPVDRTVESIFERLMTLLLGSTRVEGIPFIWFWPNGAPSCATITHDIETAKGRDFCSGLMDLDEAHGIKSGFFVIPEGRYRMPSSLLEEIRRRGFEVGVHDLNHDGRLFRDRQQFLSRVQRINQYGQEFGASGFRAGCLYHNLEWYSDLNFSYDTSIPSVGHLEAQRGGCCTVMPFFVGKILELPVTVTQDYSLFHILNEYSTDLWKCQVTEIMENHGLMSLIAHPDYLVEKRARDTYQSLLVYLADLNSQGRVWIAPPGEVAKWWRARRQMKLVRHGEDWAIEGPESDKARIAYAVLDGGRLTYQFEPRRNSAALSQAEEQANGAGFERPLPACVEVIKQ